MCTLAQITNALYLDAATMGLFLGLVLPPCLGSTYSGWRCLNRLGVPTFYTGTIQELQAGQLDHSIELQRI